MRLHANNRQSVLEDITKHINSNESLSETKLIKTYANIIFDRKIKLGAVYEENSRRMTDARNDALEKAIASYTKWAYANDKKCQCGFFYIITSDSFPGFYKLGKARDVEDRLRTYQTYSPSRDFKIVKYLAVKDATLCEKIAINTIGERMQNEWFYSDDINKDFKNIASAIAKQTNTNNRFADK